MRRSVQKGTRDRIASGNKDAFDGPILTVSRARISVKCGDADTALGILEHSLEIPAGITVPELRFDPTWDPLRRNPALSDKCSQNMMRHKKNEESIFVTSSC